MTCLHELEKCPENGGPSSRFSSCVHPASTAAAANALLLPGGGVVTAPLPSVGAGGGATAPAVAGTAGINNNGGGVAMSPAANQQLEGHLVRTLNKVCQTIDRNDFRLAERDRHLANRLEWQQVALVVDRILLAVFTIGTVSITLGILFHAPHSGDFIFGGDGEILAAGRAASSPDAAVVDAVTAA